MRDRLFDHTAFKERRKQKLFTQPELARLAGVSVSYLKYLESGRTQPSDPYAAVLAAALGCTVDDFSTPKDAAA